MPRKESTMTDALRAAISKSGVAYNALAKETGLKKASIIRFMRGETSLRLDLADKLAAYFGLELMQRKRR
jgi:ribosome-binding protein aMBF1 (putative translation factor)